MYKKYLLSIALITKAFLSNASAITPLPLSYGALLYDIEFANGPGSHATIDPGQWAPNIEAFNNGALPKNKITRLYPYSSDIEITCVNHVPGNCSISPGYMNGGASVSSYHNALPNSTILPIVDISFNYLDNVLLKTDTALADQVAQSLVTQLCSDPNVDGVFFDIETGNSLGQPGIVELYRQVSKLFISSQCVDPAHPKGRYMGIYLTPVNNDWATTQIIFAGSNNNFLAIPLYDVSAFSKTPSPDPLSVYSNYVTSALGHANTYSAQYKVPYSIIVPAAASFGTFQEYGIYNASEPAPTYFQLITDFSKSNATQLNFVQSARNIACTNQNPYFMGIDYWAWNQYVNPGQNADGTYQLTMPNIPNTDVVTYLQQYASCQ